ncbi:MAG: TonB-dependent receptor [Saprospiraceae bacterium]|nr:TonB-dependent receptor [Saprospiraceae bacterium]MCF8250196.1 TonB-dependent receptor [Saprospiraceae bacterium]MCF8280041.1 TonB-dependent receptor [Bacteroidales bacterium]MCF8312004.1 TonB-dependent receptor [Saprospiraceae bacterium]MCF8441101.1 TonB-dependent receptor [Saprospiraceae bacterium]
MKLVSIFTVFFLSVFTLNAQNSITGHVLDAADKSPIIGATVFIADLKTGTATDENGAFSLQTLPKGSFLAEVSALGYAKIVLKVNTSDTKQLDILLSETAVEMQEVIVTGVSSSTEKTKNPVPVAQMRRDMLLQNTSTNLIDALSKLPGVNQVSTGTAISKPVIRGLGYNRVVVLRNGIRQEGQQWGDEHGIELDENDVERVEIIKGPGSLLYGSDAMAGVVNFLLPHPVAEGTMSAEASTEYQTNSNLAGTSLMQAGNLHGVHWQGRGTWQRSGNFQNPVDGHVLNSGSELYAASGFIGINRNWGHSQLHLSSYNQRIGIPEGERDSLGNFTGLVAKNGLEVERSFQNSSLSGWQNSIGVPFQRVNHQRVAWSNTVFFGESKLNLDLAWQQNRRREYGNVLDLSATELYFKLNTLNANLKYFIPEKNNWKLTMGLSSQHQINRNFGEAYIIPAYQLTDGGAFVFGQKELENWFFSGGLRFDYRHLSTQPLFLGSNEEPVEPTDPNAVEKFAEFQRDFTNMTGSIGATYQISKPLVARLNASRGFRSPNLAELGSNGQHEGTFRYEIGNQNLKAETSLQADAGITYSGDHVVLDVSGFYNSIQHFIFLEKMEGSGGDSLIDGTPAFRFVQGNAALFGGEVSFDLHPHPFDFLHFENAFSYVRGQLSNLPIAIGTDSLSNLPFMPPAKLQSELRAQLQKPWKSLQTGYVKLEGEYFFKQGKAYTAFDTETPTNGYFLLNAGIGADFMNKKNVVVCRLFLSAENLLDTAYFSHLSRLKYAPENPVTGVAGIYNPGRNFGVKLVVPIGIK